MIAACSDPEGSSFAPVSQASTTPTTRTSSVSETSATTSSTSALFATYRLGFANLGPVKVGMTFDEAEVAAGVSLNEGEPISEGCDTWSPGNQTVTFLAVNGRLATITVGAPFMTVDGISVGVTRDEIAAVYGDAQLQERTNRFAVREIVVTPTDPELDEYVMVFLFSTMGEGVESIRARLAAEMVRDEGCA